jgi:aminoglycoside phosphotransferase (APT) family kinase protein
MPLDAQRIGAYLQERTGRPVDHVELVTLGKPHAEQNGAADTSALKTFGYGHPVLICYQVDNCEQRAVLRTMAATPFGHELRADRAAGLVANFDSFNQLPRHASALDVGAITRDGRLVSLGEGEEFYLLTDYVPGQLYADDLQRLAQTGALTELDVARARELAIYLATIHATTRSDPVLYRRHLRDVFGSGEGIAGLLDSYPPTYHLAPAAWQEQIERRCVHWRWRLKSAGRRAAQIHGDFHPFNVLFDGDTELWALDRSRSPWGEAADDVCAMSINYVFFSLQRSGVLASPFQELWTTFWHTYLAASGDTGILRAVQPFFAWRALVLASPLWYNIADGVRQTLFHFADTVLDVPLFDPDTADAYLGR